MMDKVMTDGQVAYVFQYSGAGHEKNYDFYDKIFSSHRINVYYYYGEERMLSDVYAEVPPLCFYCVPGVWIDGDIDPCVDWGVPFYGDNIMFPELLVPCLDTGIMLPPRFHFLAGTEPDIIYDYDFPCVVYDGQLSNSVHLAPAIDTMQIEHVLYMKKYSMGLPIYAALQSDDFIPLIKTKLKDGIVSICVLLEQPPRDNSMPFYDLGGGYYILFLPSLMERDEKGFIIPGVGLGEVIIKSTHIVQKGDKYIFC